MSHQPRSSSELIEWYSRNNPAKWAAYQIAVKGQEVKTIGEAMEFIEGVVKEAIEKDRKKRLKYYGVMR